MRLRPATASRVAWSRRRRQLRPSEAGPDTQLDAARGHGRAVWLAQAASDRPRQPFLSAASAAAKLRRVADAARDPANRGQAERLRSAHAAEELAGQRRLLRGR